jgi:hypothetical protein
MGWIVDTALFLKGQEQEANGYDNVVLSDNAVTSPEAKFESFDKIPARRPLLTVTALLAVAVFGVVT